MDSCPPATRSIAGFLGLAACVIALAVAIVLPAQRTHHFGVSYKPVEVRQSAARHEFLEVFGDCSDSKTESPTVQPASLPVTAIHVDTVWEAWRAAELTDRATPTPRDLMRLQFSSEPCGPPPRLA